METFKKIIIALIIFSLLLTAIILKKDIRPAYNMNDTILALEYYNCNYSELPDDRGTIVEDVLNFYNKNNQVTFANLSVNGSMGIPSMKIKINETISDLQLVTTLAHELEHTNLVLKDYKANYNAIIKLWESDIEYFKYAASEHAKKILTGYVADSYNCSNELIQYFRENKELQ